MKWIWLKANSDRKTEREKMQKNTTIIFLFLTLMLTLTLGQLASAEWQRNTVNNQTTEDIFVIYSTLLGRNTERNIPAGYRTVGYYRVRAGQQRSFWAWANNRIYFRIVKKSGQAIKPLSSTPTVSFWVHPRQPHTIVTQRAISVPVATNQLLYTNRDNTELVERDGFILYANGSHVTINSAWVNVESPPELQRREGTVTFVSKRTIGLVPKWYTATIETDIPNCTKILSFRTKTYVSASDDPFIDEEHLTVEQISDTRLRLSVRLREYVAVPHILDVVVIASCQVDGDAPGAPSLRLQPREETRRLSEIWQELSQVPSETVLLSNYPNPFNPETWIPYHLAKSADVTLVIYSAEGRLVRQLALGHQAAGYYQNRSRAAYWDGRNSVGERVASGLYFYTLRAGDFTATGKMLIMK